MASVRQGRSKDRWEELEGLLCPTLVIRGGDSDELTSETYEKMLDSNPRLTGRVISGAGHWVHFDQADEFGQALLNFFASTP